MARPPRRPLAFGAVKVQSECLSFHMSHHYVVDCREKGMEKWETERQSCSLMACKVISCGLVELRAASLGCNSWQSCPPFTLANPSFRAFSLDQIFIEGAEREGRMKQGRKWWRQKRKLQSGRRMKRNFKTATKIPSGSRLFDDAGERRKRYLDEPHDTSV